MNIKKLEKILAATAILLAAFIFASGTLVTINKKNKEPFSYRKADPAPEKIKDYDSFTQIGQLRTFTKTVDGEKKCTVVVNPYFSYSKGDFTFYEELASKRRSIESIILNYFSSKTKEELVAAGEIKIKEDLLELINSDLYIGKIKGVYFNEYLLL